MWQRLGRTEPMCAAVRRKFHLWSRRAALILEEKHLPHPREPWASLKSSKLLTKLQVPLSSFSFLSSFLPTSIQKEIIMRSWVKMESHMQNHNRCVCMYRARSQERSMTFCTHTCRNHYKPFLEDIHKQMSIIRDISKNFPNQSLLHELRDSCADAQEYLSNMLLMFHSWPGHELLLQGLVISFLLFLSFVPFFFIFFETGFLCVGLAVQELGL